MSELEAGLVRLNQLPDEELDQRLFACCSCRRFCREMLAARPWPSSEALFAAAERAADQLEAVDWLEAFSHHPRIGESALRARFAGQQAVSWSAGEQAGMAAATEDFIGRLADGNRRYEARFGFIFLICATGKSAAEMVAALEERLGHEREQELAIAAAEQRKITRLRLEKTLREL